jgi:predicted phosphoribosyltransferase
MFENREEAAKLLSKKINFEFDIIAGILRGGFILAYVIAREKNKKAIPIISRKLRVPFEKELAFGAICEDIIVLNEYIIKELKLKSEEIKEEIENQKKIINEMKKIFGDEFTKIKNKRVLIVDDGIATGATVKAAAKYMRKNNNEVIIGTPIIAHETYLEISKEFKVIALEIPKIMPAIGMFYKDFREVKNEEILELMKKL